MASIVPSSAADIATRLKLRGGQSPTWFAIVSARSARRQTIEEFQSELELLSASPVRIIVCAETPWHGVLSALHKPDDDIVILVGLERWTESDWNRADLTRSALERNGPVLFWLSGTTAEKIADYAPNIRSYLGSSLYLLRDQDAEMTEDERLTRLGQLRERFGLTDEEVIRRAEEDLLPASPNYAEWLILLGRADLV